MVTVLAVGMIYFSVPELQGINASLEPQSLVETHILPFDYGACGDRIYYYKPVTVVEEPARMEYHT